MGGERGRREKGGEGRGRERRKRWKGKGGEGWGREGRRERVRRKERRWEEDEKVRTRVYVGEGVQGRVVKRRNGDGRKDRQIYTQIYHIK